MQGDNQKNQAEPPQQAAAQPVVAPKEIAPKVGNSSFNYHNEDQPPQPEDDANFEDIKVSWSASEFIEHSKGFGWYAAVFAGIAVVAAIAYLLLHSLFSTVALAVIGVIFVISSVHKPKTVNYEINSAGIHLGNKFKSFDEFKSFSIFDEGSLGSITLSPLKRFTPPITIYYGLKDEDNIVDALTNFLPREEIKKDAVEQLMHKIHF